MCNLLWVHDVVVSMYNLATASTTIIVRGHG